MNYKQSLYFIAKCLTISLEEKNRDEIEKQLKSMSIDWDTVVKVSTAHYVFPALYCNLKRSNFLHYLPEELVTYMEQITNLNRERNKKIITQAKDLNSLLLANNIRPIFLKGTGNLLAGIYEDIAERMVGDIDLIFHKGQIGDKYNIGGSNEMRNIDLINKLITITDSLLDRPKGASTKLISYVSDRPGHDFRYAIDSSKLKNWLGWKASDNFNENIENTVSWYIKQYG